MTLAEAKDTKRWWLQNSYKHKGEETPANVTEALRILDSGSTTASDTIKVLNSAPQLRQVVGFTTAKEEAEPVLTGGGAKQVVAPKRVLYGTDDEFTSVLALLAEERKTASPERITAIDAERQAIYSKRTYKKGNNQGSTAKVTPAPAKPKAAQKPVNLVVGTPAKPSQLPKIIQSEPVEIPPTPAPVGDQVNHPAHYGGDSPYEAIKVIEAWELDFCLGNAVKYISRAGKKDPSKTLEDLKKAQWYLARKIQQLEQPGK
jgi:hypothetical protein